MVGNATRLWRRLGDETRGVSAVIGVLLLLSIVVVIAAIAGAGFVSLGDELPEETPPSSAFDLEVQESEEQIEIVPTYMSGDTQLELRINGKTAYEWTGNNVTDAREVTCLKPGDDVRIVNTNGDRESTAFQTTIEQPQDCSLDGVGEQFTFAKVGDREVPILDPGQRFNISIDPNGPDNTLGDRDIPATNPWNVVFRYDREVEGLEGPVYVIVFADNVGSTAGFADASYSESPPDDIRERANNSFNVKPNGDIQITAGSSQEPTDDAWLVFKPGCDQSTFKYAGEAAGYDNQILLDGEEIIANTNGATIGSEYTADAVDCL